MQKDNDFAAEKIFTIKGLAILLVFSFIATVSVLVIALNEHRNLEILWEKYDDAVSQIEDCQESVSYLSQQLQQYEDYTTQVTETTEDFSHEEYEEPMTEIYYEEEYIEYEFTTEKYGPPPTVTAPDTTTTTTTTVTAGKYYVTKSGSKYHVGTCSFLNKSKIAITMDQIKAEGYTPCSRCIK